MKNKINVAELLKDCSSGMELDCTMYEDVYFDYVDELNIIHCYILYETHRTSITFNQHGTPNSDTKSKCVIFPKGKTTWEGFQSPFKDGDIIYNRLRKKICIYYLLEDEVPRIKGCRYNESEPQLQFETLEYPIPIAIQDYRLATEEEKQKLFDAIKDKGYKWNTETKTLEKLIELKFKVGDRIRNKKTFDMFVITHIDEDSYYCGLNVFWICDQDDYELVPNKFDITTLKPFARVLVRTDNERIWSIQFFERLDNLLKKSFRCMGGVGYRQCIPYKGNEHLLNTANNCDNFYKTWEK